MHGYILLAAVLVALAGCSSLAIKATDPKDDPQRYPFPGSSSGIGRS